MSEQHTHLRAPLTWEANLLVVAVSMLVLIGGAVGAAFGLIATMVIAQALVILPALLWIAIRRLPVRATLRLHPLDWRMALWSGLLGLTCWPVVAGMATLIEQGLALIGPSPELPAPSSLAESLSYAVVLILLAPLTEEPVFRGFVQSAWLRRGTGLGLGVSGFLFAAFHFQLAALIPLTVLGIVLGFLVYRSNSLYSSLVAHACYNTVGTLFVVIPSLRVIPDWTIVLAGAITLPIATLLLWLFARQRLLPAEAPLPRESSSWSWIGLSMLAVLGLLGLSALIELILRLSPELAGG